MRRGARGVQAQGTDVVACGEVVLPHVGLTDAHVRPCAHVVGLQLQGTLVGGDGLRAVRAVGQRRPQLVPQRVVLRPDGQRRPATAAPQAYITPLGSRFGVQLQMVPAAMSCPPQLHTSWEVLYAGYIR